MRADGPSVAPDWPFGRWQCCMDDTQESAMRRWNSGPSDDRERRLSANPLGLDENVCRNSLIHKRKSIRAGVLFAATGGRGTNGPFASARAPRLTTPNAPSADRCVQVTFALQLAESPCLGWGRGLRRATPFALETSAAGQSRNWFVTHKRNICPESRISS